MKRFLVLALALVMVMGISVCAMAEAKITFQMNEEPQNMDPTMNDYSSGSYALQSLFRGLYKYDENNQLVPAMAQSYEVSEDGCTYTFKLREGLMWSDGTPLTAYDFEYSWKRALDPAVGSETAYTLYGVIKNGYECFVDGTVAVDDLPIHALDDTTLQVELIAPTSYFLTLTATTAFMPVKQALVEEYGNDWVTSVDTYVCNGPFMLAEMKQDESYTFVKNPYYYAADEVKVDTVQYVFLNASETVKMAFDNGELDIATSINADANAQYAGTDRLMTTDRIGFRYYEFNCESGPFADARVRKALSMAINRDIICDAILQDTTLPELRGFVPHAFMDLVEQDKTWREVNGDSFTEDLEAAKALLAEAGYPDGEGFPTFRLVQTPDSSLVRVAEAMAQMWKQYLNINAEIVTVESGVYWADDTGTRDAGEFEVCYMGYTMDFNDPSAPFFVLENAEGNAATRWDCPEYLELMTKLRSGVAGAEREELCKQAEAMLSEEFPVMPIYSYVSTALVAERVQGFTRNSNGHPNFEYCTVTE